MKKVRVRIIVDSTCGRIDVEYNRSDKDKAGEYFLHKRYFFDAEKRRTTFLVAKVEALDLLIMFTDFGYTIEAVYLCNIKQVRLLNKKLKL